MTERDLNGVDPADAAIDRAVREIMSAEPRPGFTRRVLARLSEPPQRIWGWPQLGVAAAAALAIVLLGLWPRTEPRPPTAPVIVQNSPLPASPPATAPSHPTPPASTPAAVRSTAPTRPAPASPRVEPRMVRAASLLPDVREIEAAPADPSVGSLDALEPIRIPQLQTPEVILRPLAAIDRIAIAPLSPPR